MESFLNAAVTPNHASALSNSHIISNPHKDITRISQPGLPGKAFFPSPRGGSTVAESDSVSKMNKTTTAFGAKREAFNSTTRSGLYRRESSDSKS